MLRPTIRGSLLGTCAVAALTLGVSYGAQAQTQINGGGSTLAGPIYQTIFTNITTQVDPTIQFNYASVGSGAGARGVLCDDGSQVPVGGVNPTTVHYGASDNPLTATQINDWNASTNTDSGTGSSACVGAGGGIGYAQGGPLMQIPTIGTPVTIAYNNPNQTANGGLTFTDAQLCGIFSGKITSWTDPLLSGIATRHAPTGPITVVYRSDGSGTSALLTAHLNKVCTFPGNSNVSFTSTQTFAQLFGGSIPANFVGANGSANVAASIGLDAAQNGTVTGISGSIGYISPDYTQIASIHKGGAYPPVAKVINSHSAAAVLPDYADTVAALNQAALPGQTGGGNPAIGTQYVPTIPDPTVGYPIVGYTTWILPTCYQDNNVVNGIYEFLSTIYSVPDYISLIQQQGFVQLPSALVAVINANILGNNNGYNIDIDDANICQNNGVTGPGTFVGR